MHIIKCSKFGSIYNNYSYEKMPIFLLNEERIKIGNGHIFSGDNIDVVKFGKKVLKLNIKIYISKINY